MRAMFKAAGMRACVTRCRLGSTLAIPAATNAAIASSAACVVPRTNVALFLDLDNVVITKSNQIPNEDVISAIMKEANARGRVVLKRAYMDSVRYTKLRPKIAGVGIDIIDMPYHGMQQKNSADLKLTVDAVCFALQMPNVDTFFLASGDSDFTPLLQKLRELNKHTVVLSRPGNLSTHLEHYCDEVLDIDELVYSRPLEQQEYEAKLKATIVLSAASSRKDAYVPASQVKKYENKFGTTSCVSKMEMLVRHAGADQLFESKTENGELWVRPSKTLGFDRIDFTDYEFQNMYKHIIAAKLPNVVIGEPIQAGLILRQIHAMLSPSGTVLEYSGFGKDLRARLWEEDGIRTSASSTTKLVKSLAALELIHSVEPQNSDGDDDDEITVRDVASNKKTSDNWMVGGNANTVSFALADRPELVEFSGFRTAFDIAVVDHVRSLENRVPMDVSSIHAVLHGPWSKSNGSLDHAQNKSGKPYEPAEAPQVTKRRIECILSGEPIPSFNLAKSPKTTPPPEPVQSQSFKDRISQSVSRWLPRRK